MMKKMKSTKIYGELKEVWMLRLQNKEVCINRIIEMEAMMLSRFEIRNVLYTSKMKMPLFPHFANVVIKEYVKTVLSTKLTLIRYYA